MLDLEEHRVAPCQHSGTFKLNPGGQEYKSEDTQEDAEKVYLYPDPSIRSALSVISIHTGKEITY